jgi:hypothetical protein
MYNWQKVRQSLAKSRVAVCSGTAVGKKRRQHLREMPQAKFKLLRPYHLAAAGLAVPRAICHT